MKQGGGKRSTPLPIRRLISKFNHAQGRYRSAGVPVSAAVHGLISRGNAARAAGDWKLAARHYDDAVAQAPELAHIWIQLGHMHKELGDYEPAMAAYGRAEAIDPLGEGSVQQGKVAMLQKKDGEALQHFLRAYRADQGNADALSELLNALERRTKMDRQALAGMLQSTRRAPLTQKSSTSRSGDLVTLDSLLERAGTGG